jgi:hypothetical protein
MRIKGSKQLETKGASPEREGKIYLIARVQKGETYEKRRNYIFGSCNVEFSGIVWL